ncbi:hypothetical protein ACM26V_00165 [Salipaludibacillus sp. HK11]|uniref:hypothetical protein n=1 Tax=Salipaludibacillus sp. HK11 TaxID=3394320 RepID=UPI0039FC47CE
MTLLLQHLTKARKKEISLVLGRMLDHKELEFISWLSKREADELSKKKTCRS